MEIKLTPLNGKRLGSSRTGWESFLMGVASGTSDMATPELLHMYMPQPFLWAQRSPTPKITANVNRTEV
jgi:hypothetical protein